MCVQVPISPNRVYKSLVNEILSKFNRECSVKNVYRFLTQHRAEMKIIALLSNKFERYKFTTANKHDKIIAKQLRDGRPSKREHINEHLTKFRVVLLGK